MNNEEFRCHAHAFVDWMADYLNEVERGAQCMLWQTSPAATEMETRVLDWLRQMIGLPDEFPRGVDDPGALDKLNSRLLEALNDSGALYLTQNLVNGAYTIRLSIGRTSTERRHVAAAWQRIRETARSLM